MSEEDIRKIYRKGEEAMIAFVMDLLKQLNTVNAQDKKPLSVFILKQLYHFF